ncbi:sigma-70 family RNA polymerase sigma factor [Bordetella genomosp. 12]|uniref:sigma-70 family RNA polymerase sigma factor n=1 Tax=Bordetella genomosp. 12 TaxID=463035 RepID=UPI001FCA1E06|nr:sigma-70 family RNA polymerase sigma factor [Bordetella genomosp. 12]
MSAPAPAPSTTVESLYCEHHGWLQDWLRLRLGNRFDAADLAQDTFLRLLNRGAHVSAREPRALLTTIAKGVVANFYRRRDLENAYLEAIAHLPVADVPDAETRAILLEALVEIDRRLESIGQVARRAFLLSQVDGMKQTDIARELGISLATVQRHIVRAAHQCFFGL